MEITIKNYREEEYLPKYQLGGEMNPPAEDPNAAPVEGGAPQGGEGDPQQQLLAACLQALETQNCELAMQVCAAILQSVGGAPAGPSAPEGAQPVFKKGGKFSKWIRK